MLSTHDVTGDLTTAGVPNCYCSVFTCAYFVQREQPRLLLEFLEQLLLGLSLYIDEVLLSSSAVM